MDGIVGVTGLVGQALLELCREAGPLQLRVFASSRWATQRFEGLEVQALAPGCFAGLDQVFFCTQADVSSQWVPEALRAGCRVIDGSSAFRQDPAVPLVIPEVNGHQVDASQKLLASPNCIATIALMALAPLQKLGRLAQVMISTYQSAAGAGQALLEQLQKEALLPQNPEALAFNLWPCIGLLGSDGFSDEELKVRQEIQKVLNRPDLAVHATCVRVPTTRPHAMTIYARFDRPIEPSQAAEVLQKNLDFYAQDPPKTLQYAQKKTCAVARLRQDPDDPRALTFFAIGDPLLKGGALNMFEIGKGLRGTRAP